MSCYAVRAWGLGFWRVKAGASRYGISQNVLTFSDPDMGPSLFSHGRGRSSRYF